MHLMWDLDYIVKVEAAEGGGTHCGVDLAMKGQGGRGPGNRSVYRGLTYLRIRKTPLPILSEHPCLSVLNCNHWNSSAHHAATNAISDCHLAQRYVSSHLAITP